jgi:hypothetical protein
MRNIIPDDNPVLTQRAVEKGQLSQLVFPQLVVALRQLHALGDHLTRESSVSVSMFWTSRIAHPDPLIRDTDPDPSIIKRKYLKKLGSYCFLTSL